MEKFTQGPWQWLINKESKKVELCGKGIEVLRFKRYGMQGAAPTFTENHMGHKLQGVKAEDLAIDIKGREHHSHWCQTIGHPDAHLIAAAPDMYEMLDTIETVLSGNSEYNADEINVNYLRKLLSKARGESV